MEATSLDLLRAASQTPTTRDPSNQRMTPCVQDIGSRLMGELDALLREGRLSLQYLGRLACGLFDPYPRDRIAGKYDRKLRVLEFENFVTRGAPQHWKTGNYTFNKDY